mgnify:CR=1 FL=1
MSTNIHRCKICDNFIHNRNTVYCSRACYLSDDNRSQIIARRKTTAVVHICRGCGATSIRTFAKNKYNIYCSRYCVSQYRMKELRGINSKKWKDSYIGKNGYEYKKQNGKFRLNHIIIYEEHYKIKIPKGFIVHHIDNNRLNNNIDNLRLMTIGEHLKHHNTILTQEQICAMGILFLTHQYTQKQLGNMFGVERSTVRYQLKRRGVL